jgi:hypothetical protein
MPTLANEECRAVQVARAFFQAATKLSDDNEDILPQVWDKGLFSPVCNPPRLYPVHLYPVGIVCACPGCP